MVVDRVIGGIRPAWRSRLQWRDERRRGDIEYRILDVLVKPGDTVVDIGANWGLFSYRLSRMVGPDGHVYAFEPSPALQRRVRRLGRLANVTAANIGLSDADGEARLYVPIVAGRRADYLATLRDGGADDSRGVQFSVQLRRLDDVLGAAGERVNFIKCDVEGHELAVLRGASETLRRARPRLLLEIEQRHSDVDIDKTFALVREHGYRGYMLAGTELRPLDDFDVRRDQLDLVNDLPHSAARYVNQFAFAPVELDASELDALVRSS